MWIEFFDAEFAMINGDQYVCEISPKQVVSILNSGTRAITIDEDIKTALHIVREPYYNPNGNYIHDIYVIAKDIYVVERKKD